MYLVPPGTVKRSVERELASLKNGCDEGSVSDAQKFQERLPVNEKNLLLKLIQTTVFDERTAGAMPE